MWEDIFQSAKDVPLGATLRVRLPVNYKSDPVAEAAPIMRYNFLRDEMVPVTQEWVEDVTAEIRETNIKLNAACDEIQRLALLQSFQPEPTAHKSEQDRLWHALRMAAGG